MTKYVALIHRGLACMAVAAMAVGCSGEKGESVATSGADVTTTEAAETSAVEEEPPDDPYLAAQDRLRDGLSVAMTLATDFDFRFESAPGEPMTTAAMHEEEPTIDFVKSGHAGGDKVSVLIRDGDEPNSDIYMVSGANDEVFFCLHATHTDPEYARPDVSYGVALTEADAVASCTYADWRAAVDARSAS